MSSAGGAVAIHRNGSPAQVFADRDDAGRRLAGHLCARWGTGAPVDPLVLGIPRGGVPVAAQVALALGAPLDVLVVRKLGVPWAPEIAMGALAEPGVRHVDSRILREARVTPQDLAAVEARETIELRRRAEVYRTGREPISPAGRDVVLVDDGLATGASAVAACRAVAAAGAARIVLAVPVAPPETVRALRAEADEVIALLHPVRLLSVSQWYGDFGQVRDDEVVRCLADAAGRAAAAPSAGPPPARAARSGTSGSRRLDLPVEGCHLHGDLDVPPGATALVVLAHTNTARHVRPYSRRLADALNADGLATLELDLMTSPERPWPGNAADTPRLAARLREATDLVRHDFDRVCLVGSGGAGPAVLAAAADPEARVTAVVAAGTAVPATGLPAVPTLLLPAARQSGQERDERGAEAVTWIRDRLIDSADQPGTS